MSRHGLEGAAPVDVEAGDRSAVTARSQDLGSSISSTRRFLSSMKEKLMTVVQFGWTNRILIIFQA
jgi:hypothetical protein